MIVNKLYKITVVVILLFTNMVLQSCSKEHEPEIVKSEGVSFGMSSDESKGAITTTESLTSMGVFTYITDGPLSYGRNGYSQKMFNAEYRRQGAVIFKPVEPQPTGSVGDFEWTTDTHHFYTYAPFDNGGRVSFVDAASITNAIYADSDKFPSIKYKEISNNPTEHTDLVYSIRKNIVRPSTDIVDLDMKHALSKVTFSAKHVTGEGFIPDSPLLDIEITNLTIKKVYKSGVLNYIDPSTSPDGSVIWNAHGDVGDYVFAIDRVKIGENQSPDATTFLGGDSTLFLIPQNFGTENAAQIEISWEYAGFARTKIIDLAGGWQTGQAYHYVISIDPELELVTVTAQLVDWDDPKIIQSEITYTYLHLEKSTYTIDFEEGDTIRLNINFSTDVQGREIKVTYDETGKPTGTSVKLDTTNMRVACVLYPNSSYLSDSLTLKAGIIETRIRLVYQPKEVVDYANISKVNLMLKRTDDELLWSNCYIINPSTTARKEYYIPIHHQIGRMYGLSIDSLQNTDSWRVEIFAYDNKLTIDRILFDKISKHPISDVLGADSIPAIKISVPQNFGNPGNIIIAVKNSVGLILWTWHLWVTDYDPNYILNYATDVEVGKWRGNSTMGKVHRYQALDYSCHLDRNIGATAASYSGQGGLGGSGWVAYQYGRLTPILGHQAKFQNGISYVNPLYNTESALYSREWAIQNPDAVFYSSHGFWCSDPEMSGKIWGDETLDATVPADATEDEEKAILFRKSIYDPSPLGWMIPPSREYSVVASHWRVDSNRMTYYTSSDNAYFASININPFTGANNVVIASFSMLWTNTDKPDAVDILNSKAQGLMIEHYKVSPNTPKPSIGSVQYTYGAGIRPIYQFPIEGSFE